MIAPSSSIHAPTRTSAIIQHDVAPENWRTLALIANFLAGRGREWPSGPVSQKPRGILCQVDCIIIAATLKETATPNATVKSIIHMGSPLLCHFA